MLTRRIKIQVVAFVVIALAVTTYLGAKYVGINLTGSGYDVSIALPDADGTFKNGEVTYRGVPVGRITDLRATGSGAVLTVHIAGSAPPIPASSRVSVADRSAIGEQYVDLRPVSNTGPMLRGGDRIEGDDGSLTPSIAGVIRSASDFVGSVPRGALNTVIDQGYAATQDIGPELARLITTSRSYAATADHNFLATAGLIESAQTVLRTQQASAASIVSWSRDLHLFATTLRSSDRDLRTLIGSAPSAARQVQALFSSVGRPLGLLMSNLVSTAEVFGTNAAGVEDAMIRMPQALSIGYAVTGSQGADMGLITTFFDPRPCTTGYAGTRVRPGLATSKGEPFNLHAGCTGKPASGTDPRGPMAVLGGSTGSPRVAPRIDDVRTMGDLYGGDH